MHGYARWMLFFGTIFVAALVIYAVWAERFTMDMAKAALTFAVLGGASYVLFRLGRPSAKP